MKSATTSFVTRIVPVTVSRKNGIIALATHAVTKARLEICLAKSAMIHAQFLTAWGQSGVCVSFTHDPSINKSHTYIKYEERYEVLSAAVFDLLIMTQHRCENCRNLDRPCKKCDDKQIRHINLSNLTQKMSSQSDVIYVLIK